MYLKRTNYLACHYFTAWILSGVGQKFLKNANFGLMISDPETSNVDIPFGGWTMSPVPIRWLLRVLLAIANVALVWELLNELIRPGDVIQPPEKPYLTLGELQLPQGNDALQSLTHRRILENARYFEELRDKFSFSPKHAVLARETVDLKPPEHPNLTLSRTGSDVSNSGNSSDFDKTLLMEILKGKWTNSGSAKSNISVYGIGQDMTSLLNLRTDLRPLGFDIVISRTLLSQCQSSYGCGKPGSGVEEGGPELHAQPDAQLIKAYTEDPAFSSADTVLCSSPVSTCELFLPFFRNKTLLLVVDDRYERGRERAEDWGKWNENLQTLAADRRNVILATNSYDAEYVRHFTGLELPLVPPLCQYIRESFRPDHESFLILPTKKGGFDRMFLAKYANCSRNLETGKPKILDLVTDLYPNYSLRDLSQHRGVVIVPHKVSSLTMTEIYRMTIPMFMPSIELLTRWHLDLRVVTDRTLRGSRHPSPRDHSGSAISGITSLPDPNDDSRSSALGFWISFSEFFRWHGVKFFASVEDLAAILGRIGEKDILRMRESMRNFNKKEVTAAKNFWITAQERLRSLTTKDIQ